MALAKAMSVNHGINERSIERILSNPQRNERH